MSAVDQNGEYTDPGIPIELPASVKDETARNKKGSAIPQGEQISIEHLDKTYEKRYLSKKRTLIYFSKYLFQTLLQLRNCRLTEVA